MVVEQTSRGRRVIVVTGAAGGLGWAITQCLARRHDSEFALVDIDSQALCHRQEQLEACGSPVRVFAADLSSSQAVEELVQSLRQQYSRVDLLVNNAGITHRSLSTQTSSAVTRKVMDVNYHAAVDLAQGLIKELKSASGWVVNISSMAGWMPLLGRAGYCAAKSALHQYFETFREEVRHQGIRVLMVYPSFLSTDIEQNALSGSGGRVTHARSTIGKVRSAEWMANKIVSALGRGQERLFPHDKSLLGTYLYRLAPRLFLRQMVKNFRSELEVANK
ncbi:SDR family oxidoreductase [Microbulbifer sp. GL-2]|uniref:SDR family NAD(P)-dependent oxidoreductase n=1 Tax=Microbulbifer sp. GL-2 TaxID=2591606 RepID=UPI0011634BE3|nr:SDR family NAD(P)-dependent oxidoreductase [Microbulbifer sp. GL-2]BBM03477.1 short chain dehydrogenase [Microbulbifer sp. GL-2]